MEPRGYSVAIVEDDPSMRRSSERLLNAHGFAAEVFCSAEAFLNRYSDNLLACVVLDIHLRRDVRPPIADPVERGRFNPACHSHHRH